MVDESLLRKKSRWKRVGDVPDIPITQFEELKSRRYSLIVDHTLVNEIAPIFAGAGGKFVYLLFTFLFLAIPAAIIGYGIYLRTPLTIAAQVICIFSFLLSPPTLPSRRLMTFLGTAGAIGAAAAAAAGYFNALLFLGSLAAPFFAVRLYYDTNAWLLVKAALLSEASFLYLYERGAVAIKDNSSGRIFFFPDAGKVTDFE